jgi:hypothetical protein
MERRKLKLQCSTEAYHNLTIAMNKRSDDVVIYNSDLEDVVKCHCKLIDDSSFEHKFHLVVEAGRKRSWVDRKKLFDFMVAHAKAHGKGKRS